MQLWAGGTGAAGHAWEGNPSPSSAASRSPSLLPAPPSAVSPPSTSYRQARPASAPARRPPEHSEARRSRRRVERVGRLSPSSARPWPWPWPALRRSLPARPGSSGPGMAAAAEPGAQLRPGGDSPRPGSPVLSPEQSRGGGGASPGRARARARPPGPDSPGHRFRKVTLTKPTFCHLCSDFIWGLAGFLCEGEPRGPRPPRDLPCDRRAGPPTGPDWSGSSAGAGLSPLARRAGAGSSPHPLAAGPPCPLRPRAPAARRPGLARP